MNELTPLTEGIVLIVGAKSSNFDDEIKNHPRVIIWDSQQEHWTNKDLPSNTRAIFMTRWIGHAPFKRILREARKKKITIFNPEGTGLITKQVKELLMSNEIKNRNFTLPQPLPIDEPIVLDRETEKPKYQYSKLKPLIPFIDFSKSHAEAGRLLMLKANELGIHTTTLSLIQLVSVQSKRRNKIEPKKIEFKPRGVTKLDVSVEILDNVVKEIQDMRDFLIATVEENRNLKDRIERFKKALESS